MSRLKTFGIIAEASRASGLRTEKEHSLVSQRRHGTISTLGVIALVAHLRALDSVETLAVAQRLKNIASPTAIVWGGRDPFLPASLGERLRSSIPRSTLEIIPEARYELGAHTRIAAGVDVLGGSRNGFFGQFAEDDRVFLSLKLTF